jgi:hypothetical protein
MSIVASVETTLIVDDQGHVWALGEKLPGANVYDDCIKLSTGESIRKFAQLEQVIWVMDSAKLTAVTSSSMLYFNASKKGSGDSTEDHWKEFPLPECAEFIMVSGAYNNVIVLDSQGTAWRLALFFSYRNTPDHQWSKVATEVTSVAAGDGYYLILDKFGSVYGFGDNGHGQLGLGDSVNRQALEKLFGYGGEIAVEITAGGIISGIIDSSGFAWYCGVGQSFPTKLVYPGSSEQIGPVTHVSVGHDNLFAATAEGIWTIGSNDCHKNGLSPANPSISLTPKLVDAWPVNVASMHLGRQHTLVLSSDNQLWVCGSNKGNALGYPSQVSAVTTPTLLELPFVPKVNQNLLSVTNRFCATKSARK